MNKPLWFGALFVLAGLARIAKGATGLPEGAVGAVLDVTSYYVAPDGKEAASGLDRDHPSTLEGVLAKIQQRKGYEWHAPFPPSSGVRTGYVRAVTGAGNYGTDMLGPVVIWMRGGLYERSYPIQVGLADSHPLTIAAYPGEKPILDGSEVVRGWQPAECNGRAAWVAELPAVASGKWVFRQLFVNGERAERSTLPEAGYFIVEDSLGGLDNRNADAFRAAPGDIRGFENPKEVDVSVMHYWVNDHLALSDYDPATRLVTTVNKTGLPLLEAHPLHVAGNARYRLENVAGGLLHPGQWYLDQRRGRLYYLPKPGQTPDNTEIRAPRLVQLLRIGGDAANQRFVENIRITGLTFQHTAVDFFRHTGTHNDAGNSGPGVVFLQGARNCAIEDCQFTQIGEYGIELSKGASGITIAGNRFTELGCGAVKTSGASLTSGAAGERTWMNWITDNTVLHGGRIYRGAPGIVCSQPVGFVIAHNEIADFYYNGLTFGGGPLNSFSSLESRIEGNLIHDIGQGELSDVAAIYLHGVAASVFVRGNVAHDVRAKSYGGEVLYLDDACSQVTVENNLLYNASHDVVQLKGRGNVLRNNILAFGGQAVICTSEREAAAMHPVLLLHNLLITRGAPVFASLPEVRVFDRGWAFSDANLIWVADGAAPQVATLRYSGQPPLLYSLGEWRDKMGNDRRSAVGDPKFKDPAAGDFRLGADSAAKQVGFRSFDYSQVGPRSREARRAARGAPAEVYDASTIAQ